jgi:adenine-specific DNA methylase
MTCPRLIEVALPIREISAESVRDKSLRHGHISTLHLWWARRPLAASRAVVFASLVPDPDHPECPAEFRDAVNRLLKTNVPKILQSYFDGKRQITDKDPYRPYKNIADTPRNRLLMFIAKWSPMQIAFDAGHARGEGRVKAPAPAQMLDDRCLVKWETSDPENEQGRAVLEIARELIHIAYRPVIASGAKQSPNHDLGIASQNSLLAMTNEIPVVLDPFAGGGAIPLEATRLGCQAIANDYNPVAYLILRATCEFPQKFGKPGVRDGGPKTEDGSFSSVLGRPSSVNVPNVLAYDVEYWAKWILERAREKIGHLYPAGKDGKPVVGYLWARTAPCSNPTCRAEIPLLRSLLICNKEGKRVALTMRKSKGKVIEFGIARGKEIKETAGTMIEKGRGAARCPICQQTTPVEDLRRAGLEGKMGERMVAVITDTPQGKDYRAVEPSDETAFEKAKKLAETVERPAEKIYENIVGIPSTSIISPALYYGMPRWGDLFNPRQLVAMQTFVASLREALAELEKREQDAEYRKAVAIYLGLWLSKISPRLTTVGRWNLSGEKLETPFDAQAIPMKWDFPEVNPFNEVTGGAVGQLDWMLRVIQHESPASNTQLLPSRVIRGDGASLSLAKNSVDVVVTDPPYFDAIAYADLSDFFYVWLKRGLGEILPEAFTTPLTPKSEEATALKHRHKGDIEQAKKHCTSKLAACFAEARRVCKPDGVIAVMFAHQSTEAWSALINALFEAGLNVTASYPIDTELKNRAVALGASALESSITVVCRPREVGAAASFKEVRRQIDEVVAKSVHRFFEYGLRGADLIVACYGPAVGVFGRYERVERADGTVVSVPELLQLVRESALQAIAGEFEGDNLSRLYFVWANLYGIGEQAWDDARLVVQIGGGAESAMEVARHRGLFVVDGATVRLALLADRAERRRLGDEADTPLIDQLHYAMRLWKQEQRGDLVAFLWQRGLLDDARFWKLAQALFEVLPRETEDWKLVSALLGERATFKIEAKKKDMQERLL